MSDSEIQNDRWTTVRTAPRRRPAENRSAGYDSEEDEYSYDSRSNVAWMDRPRRTAFPPVDFLIKYSLQTPSLPKPLSPRVLDEHAIALKELEELRYAVKGAETKLAATAKEYNDAKTAASSINKWSSGSKTASANAERLKKQMDTDVHLVNEMKKKLETAQKKRQVVIDLVDTYRSCVAGYEEYKEMLVRHAKESEESEKEVARALRKEHVRLSQVLPAPPRQQEPWQAAVAATALY